MTSSRNMEVEEPPRATATSLSTEGQTEGRDALLPVQREKVVSGAPRENCPTVGGVPTA